MRLENGERLPAHSIYARARQAARVAQRARVCTEYIQRAEQASMLFGKLLKMRFELVGGFEVAADGQTAVIDRVEAERGGVGHEASSRPAPSWPQAAYVSFERRTDPASGIQRERPRAIRRPGSGRLREPEKGLALKVASVRRLALHPGAGVMPRKPHIAGSQILLRDRQRSQRPQGTGQADHEIASASTGASSRSLVGRGCNTRTNLLKDQV